MLRIQILAVGKMKDAWMREGLEEYRKRCNSYAKVSITEIEEYRLPENPKESEIEMCLKDEGKRILKAAEGDLIPLCIEGTLQSSESLAELLAKESMESGSITFVIGGSYGLAKEVKEKGKERISFSRMTFPHQLMRVILMEQIYRGLSINQNGKYHK